MNIHAPLDIKPDPSVPNVTEVAPFADPVQPVPALTPASPQSPILQMSGMVDTGTISTKGIIESLYPSAVDAELREEAHRRFVKGVLIADLATQLSVDENVIKHWVMNGHWLEERQVLLQAKAGEDAIVMNELRINRRKAILQKQLDTAAALRLQIDSIVTEGQNLTASQVKMAAEGAKLVADVEARALGLCDSGAIATLNEQEKEKVGKQPLVMIFNGGSLPPVTRVH